MGHRQWWSKGSPGADLAHVLPGAGGGGGPCSTPAAAHAVPQLLLLRLRMLMPVRRLQQTATLQPVLLAQHTTL